MLIEIVEKALSSQRDYYKREVEKLDEVEEIKGERGSRLDSSGFGLIQKSDVISLLSKK